MFEILQHRDAEYISSDYAIDYMQGVTKFRTEERCCNPVVDQITAFLCSPLAQHVIANVAGVHVLSLARFCSIGPCSSPAFELPFRTETHSKLWTGRPLHYPL
jgi:hypothetical protein